MKNSRCGLARIIPVKSQTYGTISPEFSTLKECTVINMLMISNFVPYIGI